MYVYAQVDDIGVCIGISSLKSEFVRNDMILLDEYDESYVRRVYDLKKHEWTDNYGKKPQEPQKTVEQQLEESTKRVVCLESAMAELAKQVAENTLLK